MTCKITQSYPNYSNITITAGPGITYTTAATDAKWVVNDYYAKVPQVNITDQDIEINGQGLGETMQAMRRELMIPGRLVRNTGLEQEFAALEAVAEHYYELERKFLEQKAMWQTLKK
jgi:hypothetical protein